MTSPIPFRVLAAIALLQAAVHAQIRCKDPIHVGEVRVRKSHACLDVANTNGVGNVKTNDCTGQEHQKLMVCRDGTIRNVKSPGSCLSYEQCSDYKNVVMRRCENLPNVPGSQRWKLRQVIETASSIEVTSDSLGSLLAHECGTFQASSKINSSL